MQFLVTASGLLIVRPFNFHHGGFIDFFTLALPASDSQKQGPRAAFCTSWATMVGNMCVMNAMRPRFKKLITFATKWQIRCDVFTTARLTPKLHVQVKAFKTNAAETPFCTIAPAQRSVKVKRPWQDCSRKNWTLDRKVFFSPAMFMYVGSVTKCNRQKNQIRLVNVEICWCRVACGTNATMFCVQVVAIRMAGGFDPAQCCLQLLPSLKPKRSIHWDIHWAKKIRNLNHKKNERKLWKQRAFIVCGTML